MCIKDPNLKNAKITVKIWKKWKMENGSILSAPVMRHILASLDSVASVANRIQKED